ncbi:flagellar assembly protein FliH [Thioalkalicoccus limnaeus]|uniref:Flagellar assembly protein FliH n=1 Tax=Thioalkalicoccus limnaeus TaxID=120681 RepID=A0ABV4BBP8_9GAMM
MSEASHDPELQLWRYWSAPELAPGPASGAAPSPGDATMRPPTAEDLEVLRQAAYEEGFASGQEEGLRQGREQGLREGREAVEAHARCLQSLAASLARPLQQVEARVEEELVALVIGLVRQLVRREIKTDPGIIVAALREALGVLPASAQDVVVKVHPDDAALLRETYAEETGPGWRLLETPAITRGGCVVVTSASEVDARVEERLASAICHVFGGERSSDGDKASELASGSTPANGHDRAPDGAADQTPEVSS